MKIIVGSKNPVKVDAVKEAFSEKFSNATFDNKEVDSGVPDQPRELEQTIQGAMNRANSAFNEKYNYSVGVESGVIKTVNGLITITVCSIYDGSEYNLGLSPGFELPKYISTLMDNENITIDEAVRKSGLSNNTRVGYAEGLIGILTNGKIKRKDYTKPAVTMALTNVK